MACFGRIVSTQASQCIQIIQIHTNSYRNVVSGYTTPLDTDPRRTPGGLGYLAPDTAWLSQRQFKPVTYHSPPAKSHRPQITAPLMKQIRTAITILTTFISNHGVYKFRTILPLGGALSTRCLRNKTIQSHWYIRSVLSVLHGLTRSHKNNATLNYFRTRTCIHISRIAVFTLFTTCTIIGTLALCPTSGFLA